MTSHPEGSTNSQVVVDSDMSLKEATAQNPEAVCPADILKKQVLVTVQYFSFNGQVHRGQMVVDESLAEDVKAAFDLLLEEQFPVTSVIPIANPKFHWDDETSMQANNSSGFNYRTIAGTNKLSNHALGRAVDINPRLNPYIKGDFIQPSGAIYNPSEAGTITAESSIVTFFKSRGWIWGGDWEDRKDYQHFEKPLSY